MNLLQRAHDRGYQESDRFRSTDPDGEGPHADGQRKNEDKPGDHAGGVSPGREGTPHMGEQDVARQRAGHDEHPLVARAVSASRRGHDDRDQQDDPVDLQVVAGRRLRTPWAELVIPGHEAAGEEKLLDDVQGEAHRHCPDE